MRLSPSTIAAPLVCLAVCAAGCMHFVGVDPLGPKATSLQQAVALPWLDTGDMPDREQVTAGQLVIHADFPVAHQHRLIRELESLRVDVSQTLGLPISDEPVHLYLFESPTRYDEFVAKRFPGFPARRAFFVETDTSLSVFAAWQDRVAEDLRHETTHGYVHAVAPAVPLWLDEGIAEYFELPRAQGGEHAAHVAHLAGRLIEGTWQPDLQKLEAITSAAELSQDHYAEAWCWVHWLLAAPDRRTVVQEYLADVRRDATTPPLSLRLRNTPGLPADLTAAVRAHVESLAGESGLASNP